MIQLWGEVTACTSVEDRFSHWNVRWRVLQSQKRCKGAAAHRRTEDVGLSPQQWSPRQILFSLWTREESWACQLPHGAERRLGVFNSQPIFCPSHQFIPVLKLSSGPTHLAANENIVKSSDFPPTIFNMNSKSCLIERPARLTMPIWNVDWFCV